MATATSRSRAARELARRARIVPVPESMQFVTFEDNGGAYHWRLVAADGAALGQSGSFASCDDAEQAARHVREGAASARLDRAAGGASVVDLGDRGAGWSDDSEAGRWLDESCGADGATVTR